jgi:hypothetical protein
MNSSELHEAFRSGAGAEMSRRFSEDEVWRLADEAQRVFVRITGGIPDASSAATQVAIVAEEPTSVLDPSILRILRITRRSDGRDVKVINHTDLDRSNISDDYGSPLNLSMPSAPGEVRFAMIGQERGVVRWYQTPIVDDTVDMLIYRLPLTRISGDDQELEIEVEHHLALLDHMFGSAMIMPKLNMLNEGRAYLQKFADYCALAKREIVRREHKTRVVQYGGL